MNRNDLEKGLNVRMLVETRAVDDSANGKCRGMLQPRVSWQPFRANCEEISEGRSSPPLYSQIKNVKIGLMFGHKPYLLSMGSGRGNFSILATLSLNF